LWMVSFAYEQMWCWVHLYCIPSWIIIVLHNSHLVLFSHLSPAGPWALKACFPNNV
jgi:hypothetical protein